MSEKRVDKRTLFCCKIIIYDNMMVGYLDGSSGEMDIRRGCSSAKEVRNRGMTQQKLADLVGTRNPIFRGLRADDIIRVLIFMKVASGLGKEIQVIIK